MRLFEVIDADEMAELWRLVSVSVAQSLHLQQQEQAKRREAARASKRSGRQRRGGIRIPVPAARKATPVVPANAKQGKPAAPQGSGLAAAAQSLSAKPPLPSVGTVSGAAGTKTLSQREIVSRPR